MPNRRPPYFVQGLILAVIVLLLGCLPACGLRPTAAGSDLPTASTAGPNSPGSASAGPSAGAPATTTLAPITTSGSTAAVTPVISVKDGAGTVIQNLNSFRWSRDLNELFGAAADVALNRAAPLLLAACQTAYIQAADLTAADQPLDASFTWMMTYLLINNRNCINPAVSTAADNRLAVSAAAARSYFTASIKSFTGDVPAVPADFASAIQLEATARSYLITPESEIPLNLIIKAARVDRQANIAVISLALSDSNGTTLGSSLITLQPAADSAFGCRLVSVVQDNLQLSQVDYATYINTGYGYAIVYPKLFRTVAENDDDSGAVFLSDGIAQLSVWAQVIGSDRDLADIADSLRSDNPGYASFSCADGCYSLASDGDQGVSLYLYGRVFNDLLIQFAFQYPTQETKAGTDIIRKMTDSLKRR